mmetsp:Transcript_30364/g.76788  ORF Transcript_30364/g.76788 Transcript_30364/m.76788 type:complete len:263 (+) Transcript_30364:764-1552(+)
MIRKSSTTAQNRWDSVDMIEAMSRRSGMMKRRRRLMRIIRPIRATLMMRKEGELIKLSTVPLLWPEVFSSTATTRAAMSMKETSTRSVSKAFQYRPEPRQKDARSMQARKRSSTTKTRAKTTCMISMPHGVLSPGCCARSSTSTPIRIVFPKTTTAMNASTEDISLVRKRGCFHDSVNALTESSVSECISSLPLSFDSRCNSSEVKLANRERLATTAALCCRVSLATKDCRLARGALFGGSVGKGASDGNGVSWSENARLVR